MNPKNYKSRWKIEQETEDEKFEAIGLMVLGAIILAVAILIANHYGLQLQ